MNQKNEGETTMFINKLRKTLVTDSGMHCLWDALYFSIIQDYDSWENELLEDEDIIKHISKGSFVPINIHSDGAFEFEIRVSTSEEFQQLSERKKNTLLFLPKSISLLAMGLFVLVE